VAAVLRKIAIAAEVGELLGSEESLAEQLGVSPPTLRQAARILEFEELLTIKRGVAGGYHVRRPSISVATSAAGTYIAAHKIDLKQSLEISKYLIELMVRKAVLCENDGLRSQLVDYLDKQQISPLLEWDREQRFVDLLSEMSGNQVLRLFILVLNFSGSASVDVEMPVDEAQASRFAPLRAELAQAIIDRDAELATSIAQERLALVRRLLVDRDIK
jgi:DNA-binding FadR family transcriptional regulator